MTQSPEQTFSQRLREAREAQGISQRQMVDRLAELGLATNQAAIARIERGTRKVSLDEAVAISAALDVALVNLFLPIEGDEPVQLTPALTVDPDKARRWARGGVPLNPEHYRAYADQHPGDMPISTEGMSRADREAIVAAVRRQLQQLGQGASLTDADLLRIAETVATDFSGIRSPVRLPGTGSDDLEDDAVDQLEQQLAGDQVDLAGGGVLPIARSKASTRRKERKR